MKKSVFIFLVMSIMLATLVFGAGACEASNEVSRLNGYWDVTMIDDAALNAEEPSKGLPSIKFDTEGKMISGNSSCNDFTGDAVYKEGTIETGDFTTTLIACENMEVEDKIFEILNNGTVNFDFDGDTLILSNDSVTLTLIKAA